MAATDPVTGRSDGLLERLAACHNAGSGYNPPVMSLCDRHIDRGRPAEIIGSDNKVPPLLILMTLYHYVSPSLQAIITERFSFASQPVMTS
jgi:hypothetical protein